MPELVEKNHAVLSLRRQCELLGVSRSSLDYVPVEQSEEDVRIKRILDELYLKAPYLGSRKLVVLLQRDYSLHVNRKRVQRLRQEMGLEAIYCRPRTSQPDPATYKHPYLLRGLKIDRPNQVWCTDITYIPMPRGCGNVYLCVVMDWYSRKVLGWTLANTMDVRLVLTALQAAMSNTGTKPEIMNSDQGSQFTSTDWVEFLKQAGIQISMDGRGRWMDNVFIERLWRSSKYEHIYIKEYATLRSLELGLAEWFAEYNDWRPHQELGNQTPAGYYEQGLTSKPPQLGKEASATLQVA